MKKLFKVYILTLLILLVGPDIKGQYSNAVDSVEYIKNAMRGNGRIESYYIGLHADRSRQCERFLFIATRSGEAQMKELLNDSSACLRLYAFYYLRSMYQLPMRQEMQRMKKDTSAVYYMNNCMGGWTKIKYAYKEMMKWEDDQKFRYWLGLFEGGDRDTLRKLWAE